MLVSLIALALAADPPQEPVPTANPSVALTDDNMIEISVGESVIRREARPVSRVLISDPDVVELKVLEEGQYQLRAKTVGKTDLWVWFRGEEGRPAKYQVLINNSETFEVRKRIENTSSGSLPRVYAIQDRLVVEGPVDDLETLERIAAVARIYDPDFVNLMTVRGDNQVQLRVVFAEVSRSSLRELGLNGTLSFQQNGVWNTAMQPPVVSGGQYGLSVSGSLGLVNFNAVLSVLEENSLARTLAQPTLVALSGQQADMLVGGEIPVPVGQQNNTISIEYKEYGVKMSFVPTVLAGDVVDIKTSMEVSDVDPSTSIQVAGIQMPGLGSRKVQSHLRMRSGTTFALAGMLSEQVTASRSKIPILGDIPLIGSAFRYVSHRREEMELMVFVTPYLVRPMVASEVPPPPGVTESYNPSDFDLFMLGSLTGGAGTRTASPTGPVGLKR